MDSKLRTCFLTLSVILTSVYLICIAIAGPTPPAAWGTPDDTDSDAGEIPAQGQRNTELQSNNRTSISCDTYVAHWLQDVPGDPGQKWIRSYHWAEAVGAEGDKFRREWHPAAVDPDEEEMTIGKSGSWEADEEYDNDVDVEGNSHEIYTACRHADNTLTVSNFEILEGWGNEVKADVSADW